MKKICLILLFGCFIYGTGLSQGLLPDKLAKVRKQVTQAINDSTGAHAGYNKPQINAIINALENWYNINTGVTGSGRSQFNQVVSTEATVQGLTLTGLHKKLIIAYYLEHKIDEELGR